MAILLVILGLFVGGLGLMGVISPQRLTQFVLRFWKKKHALWIAVLFRLLFGVALLLTASSSRFPTLIQILGVISIVAAIVMPMIGSRRMKLIIMWWASRSKNVIRAASVFAIAFGGLLVYAGI